MRTKSPALTLSGLDEPIHNLYDVLKDYIKEHQGDKGYINTNPYDVGNKLVEGNDVIYGVQYCASSDKGEERTVYAVKVVDDAIKVLMNDYVPTKEYIEDDNNWDDLWWGEVVYLHPTLFNIAEYIEEYVEI